MKPVLPKVTIMIPTYNQSEYIEKSVRSAVGQTYSNLEIVISDDSDNNDTFLALKELLKLPHITYQRNIPGLGRVANYRHTLVNRATGTWVLNLDGDDFLVNSNFIECCIDYINEQEKDFALLFGKELVFNEVDGSFENRPAGLAQTQVLDGTDLFFNKRDKKINFYHLSTLYNRKKAIKSGFYLDDCLGSDTLSILKLMLNENVAFINELAGAWRVHNNNDSFTNNIEALITNIKCLNIFEDIVDEKCPEKKHQMNDWLKNTKLNRLEGYLIRLLKDKNYKLALDLFKQYQKVEPYYAKLIKNDFKRICKIFFCLITSLLKR